MRKLITVVSSKDIKKSKASSPAKLVFRKWLR